MNRTPQQEKERKKFQQASFGRCMVALKKLELQCESWFKEIEEKKYWTEDLSSLAVRLEDLLQGEQLKESINPGKTMNFIDLYVSLDINQETIIQFFKGLSDELRLIHHPDDDFLKYIDDDGSAIFTKEEGVKLNAIMDSIFKYCDIHKIDVYKLALYANEE